MANPSRVYGWNLTRDPNVPYHPVYNPYRRCLSLRNPNLAFHPVFNDLVYTDRCQAGQVKGEIYIWP